MSLLSKLTGIHVKVPGLSQIGGVIDRNLPAISPLYNVAANVAGGTPGKIGGNLLTNAKLGLATGAAMAGGGALAGAGGAGGAGGLSGLLSHIPGLSALGGAGGASGLLGELGGFLGGNGGKNALGVAQGINAAMLQKQSSDYAKQAMGDVQNSYNERAPLRSAGIAGMLAPQTGANAAIAALPQTGNPYARKLPPVSAAPSAGGV